jgi:hypothetical protein
MMVVTMFRRTKMWIRFVRYIREHRFDIIP